MEQTMNFDNNQKSSESNNSSNGESAIIQTSQTQGTNPSMIKRTLRDNKHNSRSLRESIERSRFNNGKDKG